MVGGGGPGWRRWAGRRVGEIEMRRRVGGKWGGSGGVGADSSIVSCDSGARLRSYLSFNEALWWPGVWSRPGAAADQCRSSLCKHLSGLRTRKCGGVCAYERLAVKEENYTCIH